MQAVWLSQAKETACEYKTSQTVLKVKRNNNNLDQDYTWQTRFRMYEIYNNDQYNRILKVSHDHLQFHTSVSAGVFFVSVIYLSLAVDHQDKLYITLYSISGNLKINWHG